MKKSRIAGLGLAGLLAGFNGGCAAVVLSVAMNEAAERIARSNSSMNGQVQRTSYSREDISRMSSEQIMGNFYKNQVPTMFVCNRVVEIDGEKGYGPRDFVGMNKYSFGMNEIISLGAYTTRNKGDVLSFKLLTPSGTEIKKEKNIPQDGYVYFFSIEDEDKEPGRYSASAYVNGRYWQRVEFDVTEK